MITIARLPEERWQESRDLRLESLKTEPTAFGSSYEEEKDFSADVWKKRMQKAFFALLDGIPVGMIVCIANTELKTRHIANIYAVYVKKEYRGQGIGSRLMEAVLEFAKQMKDVIKLTLSVNPLHKAAVRLYKKFGFRKAGILKKEMFYNGHYFDEIIMEKFL